MPTWTTPKTWSDNELVTAALLNTQMRDNLDWLKTPNAGSVNVPGTSMTTTSTTFVNVANLNTIALTTTGNRVLLDFSGALYSSTGGNYGYLTFGIDGVAVGPSNGLVAQPWAYYVTSSMIFLTDVLTPVLHTFSVMWKTPSGTSINMLVNVGQFWAREV